MTQREAFLATLMRKPVEFIPGEVLFSTPQAQEKFIPECSCHPDLSIERRLLLAKATNNCIVDVHANLRSRVVERRKNAYVVEFENGTRRLINEKPEWFYENLSRPLDESQDLDDLVLPDVSAPGRWGDQEKEIEKIGEQGFFRRGTLNGFYSGVWYYCRDYEKFVMDLADGGDFVRQLVRKWGEFLLESGRQLLERGVDGIYWTDDLGTNEGPVMSPDMYREYFFPWHRRAADLAHEYGKIAIMHSHGNINKLMGHIVETGIDVLDPVGPSDSMDINSLREQYGNRLSFMGGISRFIADMTEEQLTAHLEEVYRAASKGGLVPSEEGGVPHNMPHDLYRTYISLRTELSVRYAK